MKKRTQEVYVYGSGGHAKVVATVLQAQGTKLKGFLDDDPSKIGTAILNLPVLGDFHFLESRRKKSSSFSVIVGIGANSMRQRVFCKLETLDVPIICAVHPSAIRHASVTIGKGTVVMAGGIFNVDTRIGENVIVNTGVCIDHDCVIGNHAHLAPGVVLAGQVTIGEGAFLGLGTRVIPGVTIGPRAIVGAGAVVLENVAADAKVVGVPAKPLAS